MKKILPLSFLLFLPSLAFAINTVASGFQVAPDELKTIVAHGVCKKVWNTGASPHFVATKTNMEWTNFYANAPADLVVRSCVASCSNLRKSGVTASGVYALEIPGIGAANLYCDLSNDGGGWTRVFYHNVAAGYFASPSAALSANTTDPSNQMYSILEHLDKFQALNRHTFMLRWPSLAKRNIWSQLSNPTYEGSVIGYRGLSLDDTSRYWGGLERNARPELGFTNTSALLDGSVNHSDWWFAVGSTVAYKGGIPGPYVYEENGVPEVELYVHDGGLYPMSCQHILEMGESKGSGIYTIYPDQKNPVDTYCEMDVDNGGWTLFYANSAVADLPTKLSYMSHITSASGINFPATDANHPHVTGALDIDDFSASQIMAKDVAVWAPTDFSTIEFQNPRDLESFVKHDIVPYNDICSNIDGGGMFRFRNSLGADYWYDTMNNYTGSNSGLGWGDCHPSGIDQTDASDVESRPRHWTYTVTSNADTGRVRGIGGFNLGNATSVARYFIREKYDRPKTCMDILLSGQSKGNGTYTIYPMGTAVSVECDMTTNGGGWTKVWHGYPTHAAAGNTASEIYSRSNSIPFNQMRMQGVNIGVDIFDTTVETAYLKKTIPQYFQQVISQTDSTKPKVKFADINGVESIALTGNYFFKGYGNSWRVFYTCINVDPLQADRVFLGGGYYPGCPTKDTFAKSSISTCSGGDYNYCTNAFTSSEVDATMGLTLRQYQETAVWVRSIPTLRSCRAILEKGFSSGDGAYLIDPDGPTGPTLPFRTYCDMTTDGGGWTLVWSNTRDGTNKPVSNLTYNGSINTRPRCSRANSSTNDFTGDCLLMVDSTNTDTWLESFNYFVGLKHWDDMSAGGDFQLRYAWSDNYGSPIINDAIGTVKNFDPADNYRISIPHYRSITGSVGPGLFTHGNNGMQWSAYDADNDTHSNNCATLYTNSPFWYGACWYGSMNGGGEGSTSGHYNGAYWIGSSASWGDPATSAGAGNGWMFVREFKSESNLKASCKEILEENPGSTSGYYAIRVDSNSPKSQRMVYCDMTTDGGGWTLVAWSNGTATATIPNDFFVNYYNAGIAAKHTVADTRSSINPEAFSLKAGTTDAMFISPSYNGGAPIIDNGFGAWDYNKTKCSGTLYHTSRTAGCSGQVANDNYTASDAFNLSFFSGTEGIVPAYKATEVCYSGKGSNCSFKFFLR